MSDNTLSILISLRDEASAKLDQFADKLEKNKQKLNELGKTATIAGGAILASLGLMAKAAEDDAQAEAQLKNAIDNTGASYDSLKGSLDDVLDSHMRHTNYSKSEQQAALSQLVIMTGDYNTALRYLPTALDLAAQGNMDLGSASNQLGRFLNGSTNSLRELGIECDKDATAAERLALVQGKVSGAANNAATASARLKNGLGEVVSTIGSLVLPALNAIVDRVLPILEAFRNWIEHHRTLATVIVVVVGALGTFLMAVGSFILIAVKVASVLKIWRELQIAATIAQWAHNAALYACPLVWIVAAIAAVIVAIVLLVKHFDIVKTAFVLGWEVIRKAFVTAWDAIHKAFSIVMNGLLSGFESFVNFFIRGINFIIEGLNRIKFTLPDFLGGGTVGINIAPVPEISLPRLAKGADIVRSGFAMVGERGPEILSLPAGARVSPLSSGGGITWTGDLIVQGSVVTEGQLLNFIRTGLLQKSRQNGGTAIGVLGLE